MIRWQRAAPGKGIGANSLSRSKGDAGRGLTTPIVHRIAKLDHATWAAGGNVDGGCIAHHYRSATRQPLNGCWAYRHIDARDLKRRRRATLSGWCDQLRGQLVGTRHLDTTRSGVRMIRWQRAAPGKGVCLSGLSRIEGNAGWRLTASIVHGITELDNATRATRGNVNGRDIAHSHVCPTGQSLNRAGRYRHIDRRDLQWYMTCWRWIRGASASIIQSGRIQNQ